MINKLASFAYLVWEKPFHSEREMTFCVKKLKAREDRNTFLIYILQWILAFATPALIYITGASKQQLSILVAAYGLKILGMCVYPFLKKLIHKKFLVSCLAVLTLTTLGFVTMLEGFRGTGNILIPLSFAFQSSAFIFYLPFRSRVHVAVLTYFVAMSIFAFGGFEKGMTLSLLYILSISLFSSTGVIAYRVARKEFVNAFHSNSIYTPRQILDEHLSTGKSFHSLHEPKKLFCVTISSDWRNYQDLAQRLTSEVLASTLAEYYEMATALLEEKIPSRNYFCDWIADELFIVIYGSSTAPDIDLVRQANSFCNDLVRAKNRFLTTHMAPAAIDVGFTCGEAVVGILGPQGQKKATALGDVPGRSRRIQSAGKILRQKFGEHDRVIYDRAVAELFFDQRSFHLELEDGEIRNLGDSTLYFFEPVSLPTSELDVS